MSPRRQKILVATGDVLDAKMAGPAIRAWQIAIALSREHDVELVSTLACDLTHPDFATGFADAANLPALVERSDIIVFQGNLMAQHPAVRTTSNIVVVDIYDPFHLEVLEQSKGLAPVDRLRLSRSTTKVLNEQLGRGDFFLCASGKQRDFWLGQLAGMGRINHATYDDDENLRSLIAAVPFGVPDSSPEHTRPVLKGVHPGIGVDDKVVLWGGGVYNWFDPLTLLHAIARLRIRVPNVRLYFLGLKHPNPHVGEMSMAVQIARSGRGARAHRHERVLQRGLGPLRGSPELSARVRCRCEHALRPRRDRLLLPHAHSRLLLGGTPGRQHLG